MSRRFLTCCSLNPLSSVASWDFFDHFCERCAPSAIFLAIIVENAITSALSSETANSGQKRTDELSIGTASVTSEGGRDPVCPHPCSQLVENRFRDAHAHVRDDVERSGGPRKPSSVDG